MKTRKQDGIKKVHQRKISWNFISIGVFSMQIICTQTFGLKHN